ncbi:hypothetical protein EVAR_50243_1 [Eumeta japonica]|uniref:Uncharacterized protein n=1 Tax=Eumeta variegata TaxID=151549 RepID=A0A4C1YHJ5_EUMVA|nr:hypothetical protein EVAR_50243_1 [Eumeta japonica]
MPSLENISEGIGIRSHLNASICVCAEHASLCSACGHSAAVPYAGTRRFFILVSSYACTIEALCRAILANVGAGLSSRCGTPMTNNNNGVSGAAGEPAHLDMESLEEMLRKSLISAPLTSLVPSLTPESSSVIAQIVLQDCCTTKSPPPELKTAG